MTDQKNDAWMELFVYTIGVGVALFFFSTFLLSSIWLVYLPVASHWGFLKEMVEKGNEIYEVRKRTVRLEVKISCLLKWHPVSE